MEFNGFVDTFTNEHALFTNALKGVFLAAVYAGNMTPAGLSALESAAYSVGKTYYSRASYQIDSYAQDMMLDGTDALVESVTARQRKAVDSIRLSIIASIKEITTSARALALGGNMSTKVIAQVGDRVKSPDGRTWQAAKLAQVIVRDFAYQTATDRAVDGIVKAGGTNVTITYDLLVGREYENATVTLEEFAELRPKVFHINASARVSASV